jgi:hypothetical protein
LGRVVTLKKHLGFAGKLRHGTDGDQTIYFANSELEIVYHISSMMPSCNDD